MSAVAEISDFADRERIEQALDETLFVEAGAGTGKTRQLVERIVNLVGLGRITASRIAAITFTEKAAAELYDRILQRLEAESDKPDDPDRQKRCYEALDDLDGAAIETIHAFAARILALYPLEAGLPPGFGIIDDTESGAEFAERWRDHIDGVLERPELAMPLRSAFDAGITVDHLAQVARKLHDDWDRAQSDASAMENSTVDIAPFVSDLRSVIRRRSACIDSADRLYCRLSDLEEFADRLSETPQDQGALVRLLKHSTPTSLRVGNVGRKSNWPGDAHIEIRADLKDLDDGREAFRLAAVGGIFAPIYNTIREFVLDYADERRRRGRLGFQDLLVHCRNLLCRNSEVAGRVRERFRYLLIDEFQDTDPLQTEIADAIAQGEEGCLFFVGDPKQSIYRFRRADIEQYSNVRERYADSRVHLTQNFRSQPGVTEFVNAVFGPLMSEDQSGGQATWEDLHAARQSLRDSASCAVTVVGDELEKSAPAIRQTEAKMLGGIIAAVRGSKWQVLDEFDGTWRPANYADIAVLVPTRTGLSRLLPELEGQDIPYRLESRSLVYNSEDVRGLLGILRAIDDPTDEIALVGSLRSPAFACSDADLFGWREAGGRWDYRAKPLVDIQAHHPVADALRWLQATSAARWQMSVSALVEHVIRERRLMELAVVDWRPRERWQRLRFLLDQARDFCDRGGRTLCEFLEWAKRQADEDTRVVESVVPESDNDAVRIMTIHAAKGLEFPVVVLTGLNVEPRNRRPVLLWSADQTPELCFGSGLTTPGYDVLYQREANFERAERVRLNYVAATRARDHLVVSLYRKNDVPGKTEAHAIADRVNQLTNNPDAPLFARFALESAPDNTSSQDKQSRDERLRSQKPPQPVETAADREQWLAQREAAIKAHTNLAVESATSITKRTSAEASDDEKGEPADDLPPWRRGRSGTNIGRAVHSALQTVNMEDPDDAEILAVAKAQSAAEGLTVRSAADVARLIRVALNSATVREAVASGRYWREVYVAAPIADDDGREVLLEGFIDLIYQNVEGDLVVVDYKTDALRDGEAVDQALSRYELQGAAYALALEASLGKPVSACRFLFLHANEERTVPHLASAVARVREMLREPMLS